MPTFGEICRFGLVLGATFGLGLKAGEVAWRFVISNLLAVL